MQKVVSLFRKLIGGNTEQVPPSQVDEIPNKNTVEEILADAETAVINILVQSNDQQAISDFIFARDQLSHLIIQSDADTFFKIAGSRVFESMSAAVHKDLGTDSNFLSIDIGEGKSVSILKLKKLFLYILLCQPYEAVQEFLLDHQLQKYLLQTPSLLRAYLKYIFGSFYNYIYIGEGAKHIAFYTAALKNTLDLLHQCDKNELNTFITCFNQVYQGYIPICNEDSLKEAMILFRQLSTFILPEQQAEDDVLPVQNFSVAPEKIRIGQLRHNFTEEIHFLLAPMDKLDKNKFDITIFAFDTTGLEKVRNKYPELKYEILNMQDIPASINKVREAKIDILINGTPLNGWGLEPHSRLFFKRVASVQCLWCADIVTSGMPSIDYWFVGEEYRRLNLEEQAVEKPYYIPGIGFYMPREAHESADYKQARLKFNLPEDEVIYLSTAHIIKLNPELLLVWLKIIKSVEGARLILAPYAAPTLTKKMLRRLQKTIADLCQQVGVEPERIIISEASGDVALRPWIDACDVYLDSFPYCGPTSTTEPLLVGKPVVALDGKVLRENFTAGLLRSIRLDELIGCNHDDYIAKAIKLGQSSELRQKTSKDILATMKNANYLDSSLVAKQFEKILKDLAGTYRK